MNIFITGATGFIGSHLCNAALEEGHKVIAVRYNATEPPILTDDRIVWIDTDIMSDSFSIPENINVVVHAAAVGVSPQKTSWNQGIQINTLGTLKVLEAARGAKIANILIIGSILELGDSNIEGVPQIDPTGIYSTTKAAASVIAAGYAKTHDMKLISARLTNVYGEGQYKNNLFPSLKAAALSGSDFKINNGSATRNFVAIDQVCGDLLLELESFSNMDGCVKNRAIGSDREQTVSEFATYWWKKWDARGQLEIV